METKFMLKPAEHIRGMQKGQKQQLFGSRKLRRVLSFPPDCRPKLVEQKWNRDKTKGEEPEDARGPPDAQGRVHWGDK